MPALTVKQLHSLPNDLADLEADSVAQGFSMLRRLREDWEQGENSFDRAGELLLGAFAGRRLIGIGGLNIDPFAGDPEIGRLRHLYVLAAHRRSSVGGELVRQLLAHARDHFRVVRLWTGKASDFYVAMGFAEVEEAKATHRMTLR
jgi:N-acetylglutamate synthase-like GNAT family acetyltransferase